MESNESFSAFQGTWGNKQSDKSHLNEEKEPQRRFSISFSETNIGDLEDDGSISLHAEDGTLERVQIPKDLYLDTLGASMTSVVLKGSLDSADGNESEESEAEKSSKSNFSSQAGSGGAGQTVCTTNSVEKIFKLMQKALYDDWRKHDRIKKKRREKRTRMDSVDEEIVSQFSTNLMPDIDQNRCCWNNLTGVKLLCVGLTLFLFASALVLTFTDYGYMIMSQVKEYLMSGSVGGIDMDGKVKDSTTGNHVDDEKD